MVRVPVKRKGQEGKRGLRDQGNRPKSCNSYVQRPSMGNRSTWFESGGGRRQDLMKIPVGGVAGTAQPLGKMTS